jgi:hypothetical protein
VGTGGEAPDSGEHGVEQLPGVHSPHHQVEHPSDRLRPARSCP